MKNRVYKKREAIRLRRWDRYDAKVWGRHDFFLMSITFQRHARKHGRCRGMKAIVFPWDPPWDRERAGVSAGLWENECVVCIGKDLNCKRCGGTGRVEPVDPAPDAREKIGEAILSALSFE